jgi:hypothetical protein
VWGSHQAAKATANTTWATASDTGEVFWAIVGASHGMMSHWYVAQLSSAYPTIPAISTRAAIGGSLAARAA